MTEFSNSNIDCQSGMQKCSHLYMCRHMNGLAIMEGNICVPTHIMSVTTARTLQANEVNYYLAIKFCFQSNNFIHHYMHSNLAQHKKLVTNNNTCSNLLIITEFKKQSTSNFLNVCDKQNIPKVTTLINLERKCHQNTICLSRVAWD